MKQVRLIMCLLLSNAPVYGDLAPVERIEIAQSTVFADLSSLHRQGSHVKMWAVFDYEGGRRMEGIGGFVASSKNLYEYDCTEKRERILRRCCYLATCEAEKSSIK
jgi:surface-adhesin protein E